MILPRDEDLSFLQDDEIVQVCVGKFDIQIRGSDTLITIQGEFELWKTEGAEIRVKEGEYAQLAGALTALIGDGIKSYDIDASGTVTLKFSNSRLRLFTLSSGGESFTLGGRGRNVIS